MSADEKIMPADPLENLYLLELPECVKNCDLKANEWR